MYTRLADSRSSEENSSLLFSLIDTSRNWSMNEPKNPAFSRTGYKCGASTSNSGINLFIIYDSELTQYVTTLADFINN